MLPTAQKWLGLQDIDSIDYEFLVYLGKIKIVWYPLSLLMLYFDVRDIEEQSFSGAL